MRRVIINCDHCGDEINGDPFTIVKQDTHQLNRFYDPYEIDLCGRCAKKMFDRARAGLIEPSEEVEDILDNLPEIEEEPEEIQDTAEFEAKLDRLEEITKQAPRKGGRKADYDTGKLMALARAGWSPKDIADELKITPAKVSKYLYNHRGGAEEMRNKVLKGITLLACLGFILTTFYIDSETWCMHDLFWQIPVLAVCYAYMALFCYSNNGLAIRKRTKKAKRTQEVRKAA